MNRSFFSGMLLLACAGALAAQQNPYQGVSNPPPDDTITTEAPAQPLAKPAPGKPLNVQGSPSAAYGIGTAPKPSSVDPSSNYPPSAQGSSDAGDDGIVMLAPDNQPATQSTVQPALPPQQTQPGLATRDAMSDPDGDIVHPAPQDPNTLAFGTLIRARLDSRLSTAYAEEGETFRASVASDVEQEGQILIPAGSEIDGTVAQVSTGHFAGHASMILRPETVILPSGARYQLYAEISATPGANTRISSEGEIKPGPRTKKDEIEYGGGVGVGLVTGAVVGGPAGALAGTLVGAGAVTLHLMMDHPQATLEAGTVLEFSLTHPLHLQAVDSAQAIPVQPATDDGSQITQ